MRLRVLGCHSGESPSHRSPCFLVDDDILLDAGSLTRALSLSVQAQIAHVLLSRARLDHTQDLAPLLGNTASVRTTPLRVYGAESVLQALATHMFNDVLWPDYTRSALTLTPVQEGVTQPLSTVRATFISAPGRHDIVLTSKHGTLAYLGGAPTPEGWNALAAAAPVRAVIFAVPYANAQRELAERDHTLTPELLYHALESWQGPARMRILVSHMTPGAQETIKAELRALGDPRIAMLRPMDELEL